MTNEIFAIARYGKSLNYEGSPALAQVSALRLLLV